VTGLENRLGVRLLERSTRKFQVTDLGREFYRHCEAVIAGAEEAEALIARARSEPRGTLRVSCPPSLANYVLAGILPGFMKAYPRVRIELESVNRRVDLIEERIDVAIRVRTKLEDDPALTVRILGRDRVILVASPEFADAHAAKLDPEGLSSLPTLSFTADAGTRSLVLSHSDGRNAEFSLQPVLISPNFNVLIEAAVAGRGVALMPDHVSADPIRAGRLVQVLPDWSFNQGIVHLVFTSRRGMLPATRAFIDHVVRELPGALQQCLEVGGDHSASRRAPIPATSASGTEAGDSHP
jgi:DNA-binding transcriptional LysR family regulator